MVLLAQLKAVTTSLTAATALTFPITGTGVGVTALQVLKLRIQQIILDRSLTEDYHLVAGLYHHCKLLRRRINFSGIFKVFTWEACIDSSQRKDSDVTDIRSFCHIPSELFGAICECIFSRPIDRQSPKYGEHFRCPCVKW